MHISKFHNFHKALRYGTRFANPFFILKFWFLVRALCLGTHEILKNCPVSILSAYQTKFLQLFQRLTFSSIISTVCLWESRQLQKVLVTCDHETWKAGDVRDHHQPKSRETKSHSSLITWSQEITWKIKKRYISPSARSMTTKIGKVMAYDKGLQTTKLATWFFDQVIMFSHVKNRENFYFPFHKLYEHQTWQKRGLWRGATTHEVISPFDQAFMRSQLTNKKPTPRSLWPPNLTG